MMLQGKAYWAKVLGQPQDGYTAGEREWSIDIEPTEAGIEKYLAEGGSPAYLKEKENHPAIGKFFAFKRKELKKDGDKAKPINVVDRAGQPWDRSVKIGNESVVNFKFALNEVKTGVNKGQQKPSLISIQVWEHVPYEGSGDDFEEFPTDDNWTGAGDDE